MLLFLSQTRKLTFDSESVKKKNEKVLAKSEDDLFETSSRSINYKEQKRLESELESHGTGILNPGSETRRKKEAILDRREERYHRVVKLGDIVVL